MIRLFAAGSFILSLIGLSFLLSLSTKYFFQRITADIHARLILRIKTYFPQIWMNEKNLKNIAPDRAFAVLCQTGKGLPDLFQEVMPVQNISFISRPLHSSFCRI